MAKETTDIDFAKYPGQLRLKVIEDKGDLKVHKKLEADVRRLALQIFKQAYVREHSIEEAIYAVYITGLYHGSEIERTPDV